MSPVRGRSRWAVLAASMVVVLAACSSSSSPSPAASTAASAPPAASVPAASEAPSASASAAAGASAEPTPVTGATCSCLGDCRQVLDEPYAARFGRARHDRRGVQHGEPGHLREDDDRAGRRDRHRQAADRRSAAASRRTSTWPTGSPSRSAPPRACSASSPTAPPSASDYLPFAWAETQYQGKTYALPFDTDARALWYNKDLITAAGQDPDAARHVQGRRRRSRP